MRMHVLIPSLVLSLASVVVATQVRGEQPTLSSCKGRSSSSLGQQTKRQTWIVAHGFGAEHVEQSCRPFLARAFPRIAMVISAR